MDAHELHERGLFWWAKDPVPQNAYAPDSAIPGTLEIRSNGLIFIHLDRVIADLDGTQHMLRGPGRAVGDIAGVLRTLRQFILKDVTSHGGSYNSNGPSNERFRARLCLISEGEYGRIGPNPQCEKIAIDLVGLEDWLWIPPVRIKRTRKGSVAFLEDSTQAKYQINGGIIHVNTQITRSPSGTDDRMIDQRSLLQYIPNTPLDIDQAEIFHVRVQELLLLLTNRLRQCPWPLLTLVGHQNRFILYSYSPTIRSDESNALPWTRFQWVKGAFGKMLDTWILKREEFGSAMYLYIGTRRNISLYVENRFANLIWGLEAFHRQMGEVDKTKLEKKIGRILAGLSQDLSRKDRIWLEDVLRRAGEPSLKVRLIALFARLPLELPAGTEGGFAEECGCRRNDLSHFGGQRNRGSYQDFVRDLHRLVVALEPIYHSLILQIIGLPEDILKSLLSIDGLAGRRIFQVVCPEHTQNHDRDNAERIRKAIEAADLPAQDDKDDCC